MTFTHGQASLGGVSGSRQRTGMSVDFLRVPDGHWVYAIEMGEKTDVPCWLALWSIGPDGAGATTNVFDECDGDQPTSRSIHVAAFNHATTAADVAGANYTQISIGSLNLTELVVDAAQGIAGLFDSSENAVPLPVLDNRKIYGLTELAICQNSGSLRMKGLRIRGATLEETGGSRLGTDPITYVIAGTTQESTESFERPNCNDWQSYSSCSAGEVIVGVNVQHGEAPGDKRQIMGLSAQCAPIDIVE